MVRHVFITAFRRLYFSIGCICSELDWLFLIGQVKDKMERNGK